MKKIIITAIIGFFTTSIISSNLKQPNLKLSSSDGTSIAVGDFRKNIGSAD